MLRVREHHGDVVGARRCGRSAGRRSPAAGSDAAGRAERAEEHVGQRTVHRLAHRDGEDRAARADQRAADDQQLRIDLEAGDRDGETGERVEQRNDDRHVGAADRQHEEHAECKRGREQAAKKPHIGSVPALATNQTPSATIAERDDRVDDLLARIGDRASGHELLQFEEGDDRAGEADRTDDHRDDERDRDDRIECGAAAAQEHEYSTTPISAAAPPPAPL